MTRVQKVGELCIWYQTNPGTDTNVFTPNGTPKEKTKATAYSKLKKHLTVQSQGKHLKDEARQDWLAAQTLWNDTVIPMVAAKMNQMNST